ncbi:MAG: hypothetical protein IKK39_13895 [Thermoguttaceae bacterium]|nr:hypothetical protein [Thermoguttaceae bacterium]
MRAASLYASFASASKSAGWAAFADYSAFPGVASGTGNALGHVSGRRKSIRDRAKSAPEHAPQANRAGRFYAELTWGASDSEYASSRANAIFRKFGPIAEREWIDRSTATAQDRYLHIPERNTTAPPKRSRRLRPKNQTRARRRPPKKRTLVRQRPLWEISKEVAKSVALLKKNKGK